MVLAGARVLVGHMRRWLCAVFALGLVFSPVASADAPAPMCEAHEAKGPCVATSFVYADVKRGCDESGRKGGASAMMMMMLRANQKRAELECTSCHVKPKDQNYDLRAEAHDLAAKWFSTENKSE